MNILITGGTSGIGKQIALDYLRDGHKVIVWGRNEVRLQELASCGASIDCVDVTDAEKVANAFESLVETKSIDLAILSAGDCKYIDDGELDLSTFEQMWQVNVVGQLTLLDCFKKHAARIEGASVYCVGSSAHLFPFPRAEAYGGTKAALNYICRVYRAFLAGKGIKLGLIEPGFVDTPLTQKNDFDMPFLISVEEASERIRRGIRAKRLLIRFPRRLIYSLKLLGIMPEAWQLFIQRKLTSG
ncbi:SDR family NAD(P)-dependent oxidoreductase [Corallincola platygyrae]|uniref:SDR family NAD(P)-dependent oxidoreductase n=1 Tax=Corallincola platygyrae TaxID=1193278 RepID=A0ABW4XL87_9GAMM